MQEKLTKFIDFVFDKLGGKFGSDTSFSDEAYYYEKETQIEITQAEIQYLEEKFFYDLFDPIGNVGLFKLSTSGKDIIDSYGSYSDYIESQNQGISNYQEVKELERKNLEFQNENLEYQKTLRARNEKISKLELRLKRFQLLEKWWWLIGILIFIAGFVLQVLLKLQF